MSGSVIYIFKQIEPQPLPAEQNILAVTTTVIITPHV